jgi:hypothetical protein
VQRVGEKIHQSVHDEVQEGVDVTVGCVLVASRQVAVGWLLRDRSLCHLSCSSAQPYQSVE